MKRKKKGNHEWLSGKLGNVIGSDWKGIDYIKSAPGPNESATPAQLATRLKFGIACRLMLPVKELLQVSFRNGKIKMSEFNSAISYTIKNALCGEYPNYYVDYSQLLLSRGDMPGVKNPSVAVDGKENIRFTWTNNSGTGKAKASDRVILAAYCEELLCCAYTIGSASRGDGSATLRAPGLSGRNVHAYIGFVTKDGKDIASSVYTGELVMM